MPQGDAELMAEEQVIGFKSARIDNEHCEGMQERKHRSRSCNDSTRRCDSQVDGTTYQNSSLGYVGVFLTLCCLQLPFSVAAASGDGFQCALT
jgi:hypothetical protein